MMYETLSLSLLQDANLLPDWMTLYVGVRGIEHDGFGTARLPFAAVQAFAVDRLAQAAGTPDEDRVYCIADVDPAEPIETLSSVVRELAKSTGVSVDTARRKWRYAVISEILPQIVGREKPEDCQKISNVWYEMSSDLYDLWIRWGMVCAENVPPGVEYLSTQSEWVRTKTAYNKWREREYAAIVAEAERSAI